MDDNLERKEVEQYRKDFNIKCHDIDVNVSTLSGGNQQKVLLAKWVISQPDILILDEPTRASTSAPSMRSTKSSISLPMQARPSS